MSVSVCTSLSGQLPRIHLPRSDGEGVSCHSELRATERRNCTVEIGMMHSDFPLLGYKSRASIAPISGPTLCLCR